MYLINKNEWLSYQYKNADKYLKNWQLACEEVLDFTFLKRKKHRDSLEGVFIYYFFALFGCLFSRKQPLMIRVENIVAETLVWEMNLAAYHVFSWN